jgi:hypothetical protein
LALQKVAQLIMASDHLLIRIEHLSPTRLGLKEQGLLLYSPSTVQTLKAELGHCHSAPVQDIMVYYNGIKSADTDRIVDKRVYQVRLPSGTGQRDMMLGAVQKSVTFGEGVHVDGMVEVDFSPPVVNRVYVAFGSKGVVHLLDIINNAVLSPSTHIRLGYCVIYADWERLRPMLREVPTAEPSMWLYDRLRRDYGVLATSSLFGIHTAPLSELHRYQKIVPMWLSQRELGVQEGEEGEEGEEEEEEEEEEGDDNDMDDILDDLDIYMDDSEMWR